MNQKDYKEIAKIIKNGEFLALNLADYFEKEVKSLEYGYIRNFNKKQFLKDCGVKK